MLRLVLVRFILLSAFSNVTVSVSCHREDMECTSSCLRGYKTFSMLNSAEHEILNAHKYKKYQEIQLF